MTKVMKAMVVTGFKSITLSAGIAVVAIVITEGTNGLKNMSLTDLLDQEEIQMFSTIIKGGKEFADVGSNVLRGVGIAAIIYVIYKEATA